MNALSFARWDCEVSHEGVYCPADNVRPEDWKQPPELDDRTVDNCILLVVFAISTLILVVNHVVPAEWMPCHRLHLVISSQKRAAILIWTTVVTCGGVTGVAMAVYQWMLNYVIDSMWSLFFAISESLARYWVMPSGSLRFLTPLFLPSVMLGLSGITATLLPNGSAPLFVKSVLNSEPVGLFRGLVGVCMVSIIAIASGGSAGPEGPVLAIGSALGTVYWIFQQHAGRQLQQTVLLRSLELGDMVLVAGCATIAAFFDDPLSGCIFVMEVPHMSGLQRVGALPAALIASTFSYHAHRTMMAPLGIAYSPSFTPGHCNRIELFFFFAVCSGLLAGCMARAFIKLRKWLDAIPMRQPYRGMLCGLLVGALALIEPWTLMWGEPQMEPMSHDAKFTGMCALRRGLIKFAATLITTTSGYSAGIVFPLLYMGYCVGIALGEPIEALLPIIGFDTAIFDFEGLPPGRSIGHCVGAAMLAGTMHTPLGTALLVQRMSNGDPLYFGMMLLTNYIACAVNTESLFGQMDLENGRHLPPSPSDKSLEDTFGQVWTMAEQPLSKEQMDASDSCNGSPVIKRKLSTVGIAKNGRQAPLSPPSMERSDKATAQGETSPESSSKSNTDSKEDSNSDSNSCDGADLESSRPSTTEVFKRVSQVERRARRSREMI